MNKESLKDKEKAKKAKKELAEDKEKAKKEKEEDIEQIELEDASQGFGEISLNLTTNKQTVDKRPKNLEEALDKEVEQREKIADNVDRDYEDNELTEDDELRDSVYSATDSRDIYSTGEEADEEERGPYSAGAGNVGSGEDFYKNTNTELYSGVNSGIYVAGNGNGNGGNFYDPRTDKDNPMEKDWVRGVRFNSGLEHKSKKAKKVSMDYGLGKGKKGEASYN